VSFLGRIFGKREGTPDPESWQAGDWAECIASGNWFSVPDNQPHPGPRHGRIGRVTAVALRGNPFTGGRVLTLAFAPWPDAFFDAAQFRKVNPRADEATAAEAEFTALVRSAPRRLPAPAEPAETIPEHQ
jgi:hypothetical protein